MSSLPSVCDHPHCYPHVYMWVPENMRGYASLNLFILCVADIGGRFDLGPMTHHCALLSIEILISLTNSTTQVPVCNIYGGPMAHCSQCLFRRF